MGERDELVTNLRQLIELDRGFGVEWLPLPKRAASEVPPASSVPVPPARERVRVAETAVPPEKLRTTAETQDPWKRPSDLLTMKPAEALARIAADIAACRRCGLCKERTNTVPGEGSATPDVLFIGEGPGADEDRSGRPFVGAAGQLLDKMINAMGFQRGEVFIANIVKCRPPGNRAPEPDEMAACRAFLDAQIAVLKPKVLCLLGNTPLKALFGQASEGITRMRGKRLEWQGIAAYPTFHPSYLLRNEAAKKPVWDDLKLVLKELGRSPPSRA